MISGLFACTDISCSSQRVTTAEGFGHGRPGALPRYFPHQRYMGVSDDDMLVMTNVVEAIGLRRDQKVVMFTGLHALQHEFLTLSVLADMRAS
jgi:hypothetical protein